MRRTSILTTIAFAITASCSPTPAGEDDASLDIGVIDASPDTGAVDALDDASDADDTTVDAGPDYSACAPFSVMGPYPVGVRTVTIAEETVEIFHPTTDAAVDAAEYARYDLRDWMGDEGDKIPDEETPLFEFPAHRDVAVGDGDFPLVLFSHGFGGYRLQSSVLTSMIASWGFVVAAPEHPERNLTAVLDGTAFSMTDESPATLRDVRDALLAEADAGTELGAVLDTDAIAVVGHSAGGSAALTVGVDPEFDAVVTWATGSSNDVPTFDAPTLVMGGGTDGLATVRSVTGLYVSRQPPSALHIIAGAGHLAFADICLIGRDRGGVLEIADEYGVSVPDILKVLGRDGCRMTDRPAEQTWPYIAQATIARLRASTGGDGAPLSETDLNACFGELVQDFQTK